MDKKTVFQIENLKSKLITFNKSLQILLEKRQSLLPNESIDINVTNQTIQSNQSNQINNINELKKQKQYLDIQLQNLKKTITTLSEKLNKCNIALKDLPIYLDNGIKKEQQVLVDEIERINLKRLDNINIHQNRLFEASIAKDNLEQEIADIKIAIEQQTAIITELQISAHVSRKNILDQLHQKKEDKKEITKQKEILQDTTINYQQIIDDYNTTITILKDFKIRIVNVIYNSSNLIEKEYLESLYTKFNIPKKITINEKLKLIDNKIADVERQIQRTTKKISKSIINIETRIQTIVDNYNKSFRTIGRPSNYKDQFKLEKEKRNEYIEILNNLTSRYNNWENDIISEIDIENNRAMSELEYDTERAHQRQSIMNKRLEDEYQKQILETKNNIATITENIIATRKELDMTIQKIKELEDEIVKQSANTIEIEKIDSDIEKYNAMIQQTENNIKQLCGL
jgi:hypothetical protein